MIKFGMCFARDFKGVTPLDHITKKLPVYIRLLEFCQNEGWEVYILTRETYIKESYFKSGWLFTEGEFKKVTKLIKMDFVFDWVGDLQFPPKIDKQLKVVNLRVFKELCWDKWQTYKEIGKYMPKTFWVGELNNVSKVVNEVKTKNIVLKPFNSLKGNDIFIGKREDLKFFKPERQGRKYVLQEFVDTSGGIPGLTSGMHDLRVVVVNNKVVWSHIRVPAKGRFLANAAQGGKLTEIDYNKVPKSVKKIVKDISNRFYKKYDNPVFSIDFGINEKGKPMIFEINDQIGFPRWEMKNRDIFLTALVENFKSKIT